MHSRTSSATSYSGSRGSEDSVAGIAQPQRLPKPPRIVLDSSCQLLLSQQRKTLPTLLQFFSTLPIPVSGFDTAPSTSRSHASDAESLLGSAQVCQLGFHVDTKVAIMGSALGAGRGELKAARVRESLKGSLNKLKTNRAHTLYAQRPDAEVALGEIAGGFSGLASEGSCERWGVRTFAYDTLRDLIKTCERRGYKKPAVYQGEYNMLSQTDDALFSMLRQNGMVFYATSPTADGLISNRLANEIKDLENSPTSNSPRGTAWRVAYDTPAMRDTLDRITAGGKKYGISPLGAGLRWLAFHSRLSEDDGIILSASSIEDLQQRVEEIAKGPLPEGLVDLIEQERSGQGRRT